MVFLFDFFCFFADSLLLVILTIKTLMLFWDCVYLLFYTMNE